MPVEQWIEEFLFRGRPPTGPGSEGAATFHVTIGQQVPNPFDANAAPARQTLGPMTPAQAQELGLSLSSLVDNINEQAINDLAEMTASRDALALQVDELQNQLSVYESNTAEPSEE